MESFTGAASISVSLKRRCLAAGGYMLNCLPTGTLRVPPVKVQPMAMAALRAMAPASDLPRQLLGTTVIVCLAAGVLGLAAGRALLGG